jgi:hypothetical protein
MFLTINCPLEEVLRNYASPGGKCVSELKYKEDATYLVTYHVDLQNKLHMRLSSENVQDQKQL